jgi:hypothetical protein
LRNKGASEWKNRCGIAPHLEMKVQTAEDYEFIHNSITHSRIIRAKRGSEKEVKFRTENEKKASGSSGDEQQIRFVFLENTEKSMQNRC